MGREPLLRESMVAYGRRPIAERVLQAYRCSWPIDSADERRAGSEGRVRLPQPGSGRRRAPVGDSDPRPFRAGFCCERNHTLMAVASISRSCARGVQIACARLRHRADPLGWRARFGWLETAVSPRGVTRS